MQVCVVLDDASRKVLVGGEFSNATAENSILLLKTVHDQCRLSYNLGIRECICDHGMQFYADRCDKSGFVDHSFENFFKS
ncbi:MAG: hypothetical protein LBH62_07105 [Nitrososphaerota archaeon]|nr:hypothetical protein [Nitrososphaerota archaeon]